MSSNSQQALWVEASQGLQIVGLVLPADPEHLLHLSPEVFASNPAIFHAYYDLTIKQPAFQKALQLAIL
jgi:hypothetical protein